jgi:hypothetical protein
MSGNAVCLLWASFPVFTVNGTREENGRKNQYGNIRRTYRKEIP